MSEPKIAEAEAEALRLELKTWEANFAATHPGQKPTREDIKQNHDISTKYKIYANYRKPRPATPSKSRPLRRHSLKRSQSAQTPQKDNRLSPAKRQRLSSPPSRPNTKFPDQITSELPLNSATNTPTHRRMCIGPTPQKDGIVLGLFDMLSPASAEKKGAKLDWSMTPVSMKRRRAVLGDLQGNSEASMMAQTPSRIKRHVINEGDDENHDMGGLGQNDRRESIPPTSSSKCKRADGCLTATTPSKIRMVDAHTTPSRGSATFLADCGEETPAFLRRTISQSAMMHNSREDGNDEIGMKDIVWSPVRRRPRPLGRSLSALVQGLKQMEDEKADEDLDLLRELEDDQCLVPKTGFKPPQRPRLLVRDSQVAEMPLGPDKGSSSDEEEDTVQDGEEKPGRRWKKKGQKRTTRKVNIKPSIVKWKPEPSWREQSDIQVAAEIDTVGVDKLLEAHGLDEPSEGLAQKESKISKIRAMIAKNKVAKPQEQTERKGKTKVGALAHMNFRSLKIKNKNSKGKGSGGRFGRGRR